jgi:crotonobetainyl-CoA:carnitine CoA-transferase CaiB-like acyl-CoA transferase
MSGVFSGLRVLDLSWGIAGPMTAMLLADSGADVIKIEPPGGDPFRALGRCKLGYHNWQRGKRSAVLDLKNAEDLEIFRRLAAHADVLVETFSPGVTQRLGIDYETLAGLNPRLIYATIDGYRDSRHKDRPAYDLLVGARMGLQWEYRGWPEGMVHHTAKLPDPIPDLQVPYKDRQGPPREGPIALALPWVSLGAFYTALSSIAAALYARETTGRGQHIETSLMNGAAVAAHGAWQRAENIDAPGFVSWVMSSKSPKGHFECADGRWIHNWGVNPSFVLGVSAGDTLLSRPDPAALPKLMRGGPGLQAMVPIAEYAAPMAEAVKRFTCDEWLAAAAEADIGLQEARSPEHALADPLLLADGCVREIEDPELGRIRQVGIAIEFEKSPCSLRGPAPAVGAHTAEVKAESARLSPAAPASPMGKRLGAPLEGVRVIDLGLVIAGPYGCQVLGDLGADVIKVNAFHEADWHKNHLAYICNRNKRSICVNLKDPKGLQVVLDLVKTADVVQTNMRMEALTRLGLGYETLKAIKPDIIFCHSRGHEHGPREALSGNEQTAACLAGVQYEDGAMEDGGKPLWCLTSLGDTAAGFLIATGVIQALYHRKRTGEGQFVSTSIINAHLLNSSYVVARPDGSGFERPHLDRMHYGFSALHGLYETKDRWLAIAVLTVREWVALKSALPAGTLDAAAFATAALRYENDRLLREKLTAIFRQESAATWRERLDTAGAPCEISDETMSQRVQDDPDLNRLGVVTHFEHPLVGRLDQVGLYAKLSDTPGVIRRGPLVLGDSTQELLTELGYDSGRVAELLRARAVGAWRPGEKLLDAPPRWN